LKCCAGEGEIKSVGPIMLEMKKYYVESSSRGISCMKKVSGKLTGLVTFCVETAFYNGLLHKLDMNGVLHNFMLYSARILKKYESFKVSSSINALKF
jgi:hypothetical protein